MSKQTQRGKKADDVSLDAIRHSLSHLLAAAVLKEFPKAKVGIGPTTEGGVLSNF